MNSSIHQRSFIIGDEWCFFKIYTGFKTADDLLTNCIYPLSKEFLCLGIIDKWFFIRYSDPKLHLRVRFHLKDSHAIQVLLYSFNKAIKSYIENNLVWKVQIDTYNRELERYGSYNIELSETLFFNNSNLICEILLFEKIQKNENFRWLIGLKMIDTFLSMFGFSISEKREILNLLQNNFKKEYCISRDTINQFKEQYRIVKPQIVKIMDSDLSLDENINCIFKILSVNNKSSQIVINEMLKFNSNSQQASLNNLIISHLHMNINRLFRTQQRVHELVIYDYLFCFYNSRKIQENNLISKFG